MKVRLCKEAKKAARSFAAAYYEIKSATDAYDRWNALREVINQGQDNIEKQEKNHRAVNKKAKDEKKKYHISEELFPKNLKLSDRQRYVELALKYIASQKIDVFDTLIENER